MHQETKDRVGADSSMHKLLLCQLSGGVEQLRIRPACMRVDALEHVCIQASPPWRARKRGSITQTLIRLSSNIALRLAAQIDTGRVGIPAAMWRRLAIREQEE